MTVRIHVNTRSNDASNWHSEIHRVLYNQQNFITCQILFLVLVRQILLCETSGCMRRIDVEAYNSFTRKRQVVQAQDIGHRVSWHGSFCSIVLLVGNVFSNAPPGFNIMPLCLPQCPAPHPPCASAAEPQCRRKAVMLIYKDVWEARSLSSFFTSCDFKRSEFPLYSESSSDLISTVI